MIFPAQILRQILIEQGFVQTDPTLSWRCVTTKLPDGVGTVVDMVAIVDREDVSVGRYNTDSDYEVAPHVQIIVRGIGYTRTYHKIKEIADFIDQIDGATVVIDGETYMIYRSKRTTNIQYNGSDRNGRHVNTIEYDLVMHDTQ